MSCTFILRLKKSVKCILIIVVLIVSLNLTFISRGILQLNKNEKIISKKLNWLKNNISTALSKPCTKGSTAQTFHPEETKNICSQVKGDLRLPQRRHFLVNHEHKLLYCWIHKVASTSWIALFSHLANRTHIDEYYREIRILSPKSAEELHGIITTKDYYKLIVVRHPFERLVSAYRDRIEDTSRFTSQAWIYVPRIFALTRPALNRNKIFDINHNQKLSIVPTFQEFVEWLLVIPPKKYDVHWNRYSDHCKPCAIHYDAIIKMENFSNEKEVSVMHNMGLELLNASLPHLQRTSGGPTDYNITCQYFQQLFSEQVSALYEIYSMDFEMFHYSPQLYINCAQNKSGQTDLSVPNATP